MSFSEKPPLGRTWRVGKSCDSLKSSFDVLFRRQPVMYHNPSFVVPSSAKLGRIAAGLGLDIPDEHLEQYRESIAGYAASCDVLEKYVEPTLPVKYPRTPGYRPSPQENTHNAWLYRTDIPGANSGKLVGKRVAIKDVIPVAAVPLLNGSPIMLGFTPDFDATVVTRILDAGGHIVGKSTCESLCRSLGSHTACTGPVLNPRDPARSAGGSSSGSAVLLALGEVDMALGTDQGGSIRIPASCTGTVGLKPTFGLVPYTGIGSLRLSMDHVGPMANTVEDCALMLEVLAGYDDGLDPRQSRDVPLMAEVPEYSKHVNDDLAGMKVAIVKEGMLHAENDVVELVRRRTQQLGRLGVKVQEVSIPLHEDGGHINKTASMQATYHNMIRGAGVCVGPKGYYPTSMITSYENCMKSRTNMLNPVMMGILLTSHYEYENYGLRYYAKSQNMERVVRAAYDKELASYDALIMPTSPCKARTLPTATASPKEVTDHATNAGQNVGVFCLTGHPAISVNAGYSEGLPVGLMIVGRHFDDLTVLKVARGIERVRQVDG